MDDKVQIKITLEDALSTVLKGVIGTIDQTVKSTSFLDNALKDVSGKFKEAAQTASTYLNTSFKATTEQMKGMNDMIRQLAKAYPDMANEFSKEIKMKMPEFKTAPVNEFTGAIKKTGEALNKTAQNADGLKGSVSGVNQVMDTLKTIATGYIAKQLATNFIDIASSAEKTKLMLDGVMGSTQSAGTAYKWLLDTSSKVPFTMEALQNSFIKLKTAGLDPMDGALKTVMDSISFFGGSSEDLKLATMAMQQMAGKGVISMEELRQQLGERIPTAMKAMAQGLGMTMPELAKAIEQGQVTATDGMKAMLSELQKMHGGATDKMMSGWAGLVAQMKTAWYLFVVDVADAGLFDTLKNALKGLFEAINALKQSGDMQAWASSIADAFSLMVTIVKTTGSVIFGFLSEFRREIILAIEIFVLYKNAMMGIAISALIVKGVVALAGAMTVLSSAFTGVQITSALSIIAINGFTASLVAARVAAIALYSVAPYLAAIAGAIYIIHQGFLTYEASKFALSRSDYYANEAKKLKEYADISIRSSVEIIAMQEKEREAYLLTLKGHRDYVMGMVQSLQAKQDRGIITEEEKTQLTLYTIEMNRANKVIGEMTVKTKEQTAAQIAAKETLKELEDKKADQLKNLSALEKELNNAEKDRLNDQIKTTQEAIKGWESERDTATKAIKDMQAEYDKYTDKINAANKARDDFNKKVDADLAKMTSANKTPEEQQTDLVTQVHDKSSVAQDMANYATTPEEVALAKQLVEEAYNLAGGIEDQFIKQQALNDLKDYYNTATERGNSLDAEAQSAIPDKIAAQQASIEQLNGFIEEELANIEKLQEDLDKLSEKRTIAEIQVDIEKAKENLANIQDQIAQIPDTKTVTIDVIQNTVETAARWGGYIQKLARGGKLAGYGGGDRIRALLEAGEFVIRKEAVSKYGPALLGALNNMSFNILDSMKMSAGGLLSEVSMPSPMKIAMDNGYKGGGGFHSAVYLSVNGMDYPMMTTDKIASELAANFRVMKKVTKNSKNPIDFETWLTRYH